MKQSIIPLSKNIVHAEGVSKSFGDFRALADVNISVPEGSIFGLLGPNGAGKTTLIRILTGITAPDAGIVSIGSTDHQLNIGYLPEERGLYRKMKVWEQAIYLTQLKGFSQRQAEDFLKPWFQKLKMTSWIDKSVEQLSKGMQQRLQFVITVASEPDLLILDEPFSGFDPVNAEELKNEIIELKENGTTIILSSHNMASVEEMCSHVCLINQGKTIVNEELGTLKQSYSDSLFSVGFIGSEVAFANAIGHQFEVKNFKKQGSITTSEIKSHGEISSSDLLTSLAPAVDIKSFEEKLPSMNDIFINLVSSQESDIIHE